jgi:hypothetical protein
MVRHVGERVPVEDWEAWAQVLVFVCVVMLFNGCTTWDIVLDAVVGGFERGLGA